MLIILVTSFLVSSFTFVAGVPISDSFFASQGFASSKVLGVKESSLGMPSDILEKKNIATVISRALREVKNITLPSLPLSNSISPDKKDGPIKNQECEEFSLLCNSGVVVDAKNGKVLFDKTIDKQWPIASITKLMTALVFLDNNPGWEEIYDVRASDKREGGKIYLFAGERVRVEDLFYLSLVGSANTATISLVHSTGLSEQEFVQKMNEKAKEIGLKKTSFVDPVGLGVNNISTAREVASFARIAFLQKEIRNATLTKEYRFKTLDNKNKAVFNTDYLLDIFPENGIRILGGKTGYTRAAGYCFVGKFTDFKGSEIITVVLGSDSRNSRFKQTHNLADWVYKNYKW